MKVIETGIEGLVILETTIFKDSRGYFFESYNKKVFVELIGKVDFVQDNESYSSRGVMRGMHFQKPPFTQAKLVRCVRGAVLDVNVDLRQDSPTYGKYVSVELSEDNHRLLFIPRGFAHGFAVLSDMAVFQYKCDNYYCPEAEGGVNLFDPNLAINWPFSNEEAILSEKDLMQPGIDSIKPLNTDNT